ncbi:MAG: DNA polymerase IV [Bacillota bacterium]
MSQEWQGRAILHCDVNNFYASVEMVLNPELQGKAVAVCGDPDKRRGIVLAKSNIAKSAGVKTGDPVWQALQKCGDLILVPPTYKKYTEYSRIIYGIYTEFTSEVESFGLDECWLDVTHCKKLFGSPVEIAEKIKKTVNERTGLTISIGVSFTKVFAKLGSDLKKPDAISVISIENFKQVAWRLPVQEMLYVGRSTQKTLNAVSVKTIGDLAHTEASYLQKLFGKVGLKLYEYSNGIDTEEVKCYTDVHIPDSIGNGTTTPQDITNIGDASSVIFALCEMIGFRLRQYNMLAGGVSLSMRNVELYTFSRQMIINPTCSAYEIATKALHLLQKNYDFKYMLPLRSLSVGTHKLVKSGGFVQTSMFEEQSHKNEDLEASVDRLRSKYGYGVLRRGVTVDTVFSCDDREAEDDFLPFDKNMKNFNEDDK